MRVKYTKENFEIDKEWLSSFGISEATAQEFILSLLEKKRCF